MLRREDALGIFGVDADGGVAAIFIGVPVELQLLPPQSCTGSGAWLRT